MLEKFKKENKDVQIKNFIEVLDENEFRKQFNVPNDWDVTEISDRTIDFIKNKSISGSSPLKELALVLKAYNIPIGSYLCFIENINGLKFGNLEYKLIIAEESKKFIEEIDKYNVDDILKLDVKKDFVNKLIEAENLNTSNEIKGKVLLATIASITVIVITNMGKEVSKDFFKYKIKKSRNDTIASGISDFLGTIGKGLECITCHFKSKK